MHARNLPLVLLLVCWAVASCEASLSTGGLVGGLAVLKGAALVSYAVGRHQRYNRRLYHGRSHYRGGYNGKRHYRYGRSVDPDTEQDADEGKNLLLSTVGQLDPDGCILKMLCHLQTRSHSSLTPEEDLLVDMFSNNTENMASYNAAFVYATDVGTKTRDPSVCNGLFPKCSLKEEQLSGLLRRVWGCASDLFRDDAEREEDFSATPPMVQPVGKERPVDEEPRQEQQTLDEDQPIVDYVDDEELPTNHGLPKIDEMFLDNGMPLVQVPRDAEMLLDNGMSLVEMPRIAQMVLDNGMPLVQLPRNIEMLP
ncbi:uncharacterized protein LOC119588915, partial [Penaeus monodon]|uniref:uncharacterized protein LOC119588915 n=1 Tax=Penaeus monodon TaxID=6687 RepID=UPI0018A6F345